MFGTRWLITCLLLLGCLAAIPAQAASLHVHDVQAKSPFEVRHDNHEGEGNGHGHGHALHCALMGHDINQPCPHYTKKALHDQCELASDCPHPAQSPTSYRLGSSSFMELKEVPAVSLALQWVLPLGFEATRPLKGIGDPPDHPPRRS